MSRFKKLSIAVGAGVFLLLAALVYYMPGIMASVRQEILTQAKQSINGALYLEKVRLSGFFELSAEAVRLEDQAGETVFLADSVAVRVNILSFLLNRDNPLQSISSIKLSPASEVYLSMNEEQQWNINTLLNPSDSDEVAFYALIILDKTKVFLKLPQGNFEAVVDGTISAAQNPLFSLDLNVLQAENQLKITGAFNLDDYRRLVISTKKLQVDQFAGLIKEAIEVDDFSGYLADVNVIWENTGRENIFNGQLSLENIAGNYRWANNDFAVRLLGKVDVKRNQLNFNDFALAINGEHLKADGILALQDQIPYAKQLKLSSQNFNMANVLTDIPLTGPLAFSAEFNGALNERFAGLVGSGQIEFLGNSLAGIDIARGKATLLYHNESLNVVEATLAIAAGLASFAGEYDVKENYLVGSGSLAAVNLAFIPQLNGAAGVIDAELSIAGKASYNELSASLSVEGDQVSYKGLTLQRLNADVLKNGELLLLNQASGAVGEGEFIAEGVLSGAPLAVTVKAADLPLEQLAAIFDLQGSGLVNASLELSGNLDDLTGQAEIYARDGVIAEQPFKNIKGQLNLKNKLLSLEEILLEMNYGLHYINGYIDLGYADPALSLSVVSKAVRLESLAALLLPEEEVTGNLNNAFYLSGTLANPALKGQALVYEASYQDYFIEKIEGFYSYDDTGLTLENFKVKFMQTSLFLHGHLAADGSLEMDFEGDNIRLENLPQLEELTTSGGVMLEGSLTGSLESPVFNGNVQAASVFVNGEEINNLQGLVWSEGGRNNYLRVSFAQEEGSYSLDAGIDFDQPFAHGLLQVTNGDVHSLLAIAGEELPVNGLLNGTISLNSLGRRSGLVLDAVITEASIKQVPFAEVAVKMHLLDGKLTINNFTATQGSGSLIAAGSADLRGDLNLELSGTNLDASLLTAFMDKPVDFAGDLGLLVQLTGTVKQPEVSASLQISPGSVENVSFDNLYGLFSIKNDAFNIDQLFISKDIYRISAYGSVPVDLVREEANRKNPNSQMDITVRLDNADLSLIPSIFTNDVEWGFGQTEGQLDIKGTLEEPLYYGGLQINGGTLKFNYLRYPLENINLNATLDGTQAILRQFDATMGKGNVQAAGSIALQNFANADYTLNITADKLEISSEMFTGPLTFNFVITPQSLRDTTRPFVRGEVYLENFLANLPVIPELGEGSLDVGLDVTVRTGEKVRLYNKYLYDMLLEGNLRITGSSRFTNIEGTANVRKGTITYLGTPFRIDNASAGFPIPGSIMPTVNLSARSRINSIDIFVNIRGPLDEMQITLSSDPPMSQQEIFRLMTLKSATQEGSTLSDEDVRNLLAAGLQMTIFGNVEDLLKTSLGIDEFRIYQGSINSGVGLLVDSRMLRHATKEEREQYNFYVAKYLTDRILISYTSSFDNKDTRLALQYELNRKINLATSIDEDSKMYYGIEYRISF